MIKVDKDEFNGEGHGVMLLAELCVAVRGVATALKLRNEFVLDAVGYAMKEAEKDEADMH